MRYKDEFHIASTAVLLSMAMNRVHRLNRNRLNRLNRLNFRFTARTATMTVLTIAARTILLMTAAR